LAWKLDNPYDGHVRRLCFPLQGALQGEYGTNQAHIFALNPIWKF
jgi:hypothetical protein